MKRSLLIWQLGGFTFTSVFGTLLHFIYDWTNVVYFAPFSAINESTWEHMKILFFPAFLYAIIEYFFLNKQYNGFMIVKVIGVSISVTIIPTLFYTLTGCFGVLPGYVNVLIFFISGGVGYLIEYYLLKNQIISCNALIFPIIYLTIIAVCFIIYTFYPPNLPIFLPPSIKA